MVKYVLSAVMGMIVFTFVKAEDVEYNTLSCNSIYCNSEEHCCFSETKGAVCCPTGNICDSKLGCIENVNNGSTVKVVRECPPLTTECFSCPLFDLCCPLPFAECCDDIIHCCAHGYECDLQNMRCNKKNNTGIYSRIFKREASTVDLGMKHCGDKTWCPELDECCRNKNGGWDCCQAVSTATINKRTL
ncbi:progranulin [Parasteatoda tepidariorum]|uniref:progranulin n=1 Tax=Parasteatoda tepidariorum TaxID=114398 RepID=UPI001C7185F8|nr:progranulin [Parasteatoda tepidariorum]